MSNLVNPRSCSVIIPARNESQNIEKCLTRLPQLPGSIEVIFIEGGSIDNTWEVILEMREKYKNKFAISCFKQNGTGKRDAVELGFRNAKGDILIILDSDLTVPPEEVAIFYDAINSENKVFANGNRFGYQLSFNAMPLLNQIANHFFARLLSLILNIDLQDTLCGTKALTREAYLEITRSGISLSELDPFGDFNLLFCANHIGLKIKNIPVHYHPRSYGKSNINHLVDGIKLLKICLYIYRLSN